MTKQKTAIWKLILAWTVLGISALSIIQSFGTALILFVLLPFIMTGFASDADGQFHAEVFFVCLLLQIVWGYAVWKSYQIVRKQKKDRQ